MFTQKPVQEYLYQLCSLLSKTGGDPDVLPPVNKPSVVHTYNRVLLSNKKKQVLIQCNSMDES